MAGPRSGAHTVAPMPWTIQPYRHFTVACTVAIAILCAAPVRADFEEGIAAFAYGDYARALKDLQPLADQGNPYAQTALGEMYRDGKGVPQDNAKAQFWYRLAAAQDFPMAQSSLASLYLRGNGVSQDYTEALRWLRLAAAQGEANAQSKLGVMYAEGRAVIQDYVQAHMWFNLAAATGIKDAAAARDGLAKEMTPAQIAEAQGLAREWRPKVN